MGLTTLVPLPRQEWADRAPDVCLVAPDAAAAVKLAPIASAMRAAGRVRPVIAARGAAAAGTFAEFGHAPDVLIGPSRAGDDGPLTAAALLAALDDAYRAHSPAAVLVQGDCAAAFSAALAAFWRRIPVVHVDAGVRSHDLTAPFPEEGHRKLIAQVSSLHLTATADAAANLAGESHARPQVLTVGSTAVDAGFDAIDRHRGFPDPRVDGVVSAALGGETRMVLVALSPGWPENALTAALLGVCDLVVGNPDVEVVLPAPLGSPLRRHAEDVLGRLVRVTVTGALAQPETVRLLSVASAVVTDRDALAEQAPSFGVPALRLGGVPGMWAEPEVEGYPWTAGPDRSVVAGLAEKLVGGRVATRPPGAPTSVPLGSPAAAVNPFGDGRAAARCEQAVGWLLGLHDRPADFTP